MEHQPEQHIPDRTQSMTFRITPHRSISEGALRVVVIAFIGVAAMFVLLFLSNGARLAGFATGVEALFLAAAFVACNRDRRREELITMHGEILTVSRRSTNGRPAAPISMPVQALTIERTIDPEFGDLQLTLKSGLIRKDIGEWLTPAEREPFLQEFLKELQRRQVNPLLVTRHVASSGSNTAPSKSHLSRR